MDQLRQQLESDVKSTRRAALVDLKKKTEIINEESLSQLFDPLVKIVTSDSVDSFRETASCILLSITSKLKFTCQQFQSIVKLTLDHFEAEQSEEVRLTLAKVIHSAVENESSQQVYLENLDNLTQLVKILIRDRYGEVVREACNIILALSEANQHFHLQADFFVEPLMQNLKTQSMKVRVMCVRALEPIMIHSPLTIENIAPQLEKSWSESSPSLKLALVQTIGKVSQEVESDDQNFHLLLPVILLGMSNDFSEVSGEANDIWHKLTTQSDFGQFLVKCFSKLISKLLQDAEDWNNDTRIQTAQLIYQFLHEIPDRKPELFTVMEILTFQSGDQEAPVRNWAWRSARLVGETCAQDALEWIVNQRKVDDPVTNSQVSIYSNIVRGFLHSSHSHPTSTIELCIQLAVGFSSIKDVSLLECLEILVEKELGIDCDRMNQLLSVALSLEGDKESDFPSRQKSLLERMAVRLEFQDVDKMIREKLPVLWSSQETPDKWTLNSLPWKILQFVVGDLKLVDHFVFDVISQTIVSTTCPEIKLKSFNLLTASMDRVECDAVKFQDILIANIKWRPGRSASVLRSCAALCAFTAVHRHKVEINSANVDVYADAFVHLVEDEIVNTRLAAIRVLKKCLVIGQPTNLDSILTILMGRLNDVSKDVRHDVMAGLRDAFLHWRQTGTPHPQMEKKFTQLTQVLSRDDDLPSKTYAEGILQSMLEECTTNLNKMDIKSQQEITQN